MPQTQWSRLDRDQAHQVLAQLGGRGDAIVFSGGATDVARRGLPFYSRYRLCRLTNYATLPTFTMVYLSDGEEYLALDGTPTPIYRANAKDPIRLTEINLAAYVEFFFTSVQGPEGDVILIKDPGDMPFMDTLTPEEKTKVAACFQPLRVASDALFNFELTATLCYGGGLERAVISVTPEGVIAFKDHQLLLTGLRLPVNPYTSVWLDGGA